MATDDVIVLGADAVGVIAQSGGMRYYLTDCCGASAKGSMGATVCRACYEEIDPALGDVPPQGPVPMPYGDGIPYDVWKAAHI